MSLIPNSKMKKVNFNVDPDKWESFKKVAKANQSDGNKELRKFIDSYLKKNSQLVMQFNMGGDK